MLSSTYVFPLVVYLNLLHCSSSFLRTSSTAFLSHVGTTRSTPLSSPLCSSASSVTTTGPILGPSFDDPTAFDAGCVAHPVVLPPSPGYDRWQMYYYGNPGSWAHGRPGFLPTGYVGLAESSDGIHWEKVSGEEVGGSVLAPTGREEDWDGLHLGVGDVIPIGGGELCMYYFGGSFEEVKLGGGPPFQGLRMTIGRARSTDGGRSWERMGQVLEHDSAEGLFASWPKILLPPPGSRDLWKMSYHAFNGTHWSAYEAHSTDEGETWTRTGRVAVGPGETDAWDESGVGTRATARTADGEEIMVYEAVEKGAGGAPMGRHRLGLARWDAAQGSWKKDKKITGIPGGPILDGGVEPMDQWTAQVIGTPYLVVMEDGSLRLYFCSKENNNMCMSIGMLESPSGNLEPTSWRPISPK